MKYRFRAWDKTTNQMRGCYGFNEMEQEVYVCSVADDEFNGRPKTVHALKRSFDEVVIMQSTGLKDKNCLEVYFNDVVEDEYGHRYEVVLEGDCLRCNGIRKIRGGHKPKNRWLGIDLEIIGNRFENPKLLEKEE